MPDFLYLLLTNPQGVWRKIDSLQFKNHWDLIRKNLAVFLILNPAFHLLTGIFSIDTFSDYLKAYLVTPFLVSLGGIIVIVTGGILIEEIFRIVSFREPRLNISKWLTFSFLPFFAFYGFSGTPILGTLFMLTGAGMTGYLLYTGFLRLIWPNQSSRRTIFLASVITGMAGIVFLSISFLIILNFTGIL